MSKKRLAYWSDEAMTLYDGTKVFDTALEILEKVVRDMSGPAAGEQSITDYVDDLIRDDVKRFASFLREEGWDDRHESEYYDRFAQEIEGWNDDEYIHYLRQRVEDLTAELERAGAKELHAHPKLSTMVTKIKEMEAKVDARLDSRD